MVDLDQCEYGLRAGECTREDADARIKKPTRILTNFPPLADMAVRCSGNHSHLRCAGRIRTAHGWAKTSAVAGTYPDALCEKLVGLVAALWSPWGIPFWER